MSWCPPKKALRPVIHVAPGVCVVLVVLDMVGLCSHRASLSIFDAVHVLAWHITEAHVLHLFMMHSSAHSPPLPFSYQDSSLAVGA